jgi:glycosyltransferase involved in cell wall biosynthesis
MPPPIASDRGLLGVSEAAANPLRIVIASHSHPEISKGGAEIAAHQLFSSLQERGDCEAWFIGCDRSAESERPGSVFSQPFSQREYLYAGTGFDWFKFANDDARFPAEVERLFKELSPQIVHFHHYINFGVEVFQHLKRAVPDCKIILTLHEYLAICHHYGQMVTKRHSNLCYYSSMTRCQQCFPEFSRSDFFLRKRYIERFFNLVDGFISPSRFLAERYIAWGVPPERMTVMENVTASSAAGEFAPSWPELPLRFGFFGQISALKGIEVILDAAQALERQTGPEIIFEIFGEYRGQPPAFQEAFLARLAKIGRNVNFHGPYDRVRVDHLMRSVHAVLAPSIWWENSPVVIEEALRNRRPVICSDIGGMAERVRDGIDGFHFPVGSVTGLTTLIRKLAERPYILAELAEQMPSRAAPSASVTAHLDFYRSHIDCLS